MPDSATNGSTPHDAPADPPAVSTSVPPLLCIGEAMVAMTSQPDELATARQVQLFSAGAEANVAMGLAHLGGGAEWFGRLGVDPFADRIQANLNRRGVCTGNVIRDSLRPTGIYFKDRVQGEDTVYYYRAGSAASAMTPDDLSELRIAERRLVHLSGITPALSSDCARTVQAVIDQQGSAAISFDINYRAKLWPTSAAADQLLALARQCTIVLVGRDEAETLWGTRTAEDIRQLLPEVPTVVVKDADIGATEFCDTGSTFVAAPTVDVVEPVGAGDAFAAGYLTGYVTVGGGAEALALGHMMAEQALTSVHDVPDFADADVLRERAAARSWTHADGRKVHP